VPRRLPDFILGGAQKSGTTSLHHWLGSRPDVFLPDEEIFFFDIDDVDEHPDFVETGTGTPDFDVRQEEYRDWYGEFFSGAAPDQLVGDHSTTYLASSLAPARIAGLCPEVRLVFLLRDPVARAHSHYWHAVRTGRAVQPFDRWLRAASSHALTRGHYQEQLERYFARFPSEQVLVLLFEELVRDPAATAERAARFLDLPKKPASAPKRAHANRAIVPRLPKLQLLLNRARQGRPARRAGRHLPGGPRSVPPNARGSLVVAHERSALTRAALRLWTRPHYPAMPEETRIFLESHYAHANAGLSSLIERRLSEFWLWMRD